MSNKSTEAIPEIKAEGWDWFEQDQPKEAISIVEQRMGMSQEDVAEHFKKCFSTVSGKIVLEYMDIFCNDVRDFDASLGFYDGAALGFHRTGQRSFMTMIKAFLNRKPQKRAKGK